MQVDALVGFNGLAREGRFAPILVSIANAGTSIPVDVRLVVSWGSSLRGTTDGRVFTRQSVLGGGATRRIPFLVPLPPDARSLDLSVSSQGSVLAHQSIDLRGQVSRDRIVVGVASELSLDSITALSDDTGNVRVVYPRIDDLPESWAAYDGVDMVVVHDTSFQQLRSSQVSALERWVVTGGALVLTGGAAGLQHADAGFGGLMPVRVTGLVTRTALPAVARLAGAPRAPRGSIVVAQSLVTTGRTLARDGDLPLVVERRLGRGSVWFLAFDPTLPPFPGWGGTLALWRLMASRDRQPTLPADSHAPLDDPWLRVMLASPGMAVPSVILVLALVALYCALLFPLTVGRLLRGMKTRLRIALLLLIPLLAGAGSWIAFDKVIFRAAPRSIDAALVEMRSGDGQALVTERVGIVASRPGTVDIAAGIHELPVSEISLRLAGAAARTPPPPGFAVAAGDATTLSGIAVGRYGTRLLLLQDVVPMPVTARAVRAGSEVAVTVSNDSARALQSCFFWTGGRGYRLGDIPANGVARASFALEDGVAPQALRVVDDATRAALWNLVAPGVSGPAVIGWLDDSALALRVGGADAVDGRAPLSLLVVESE